LAQQGDGRYMRPIVYEAHCQACHPLNYRAGDVDYAVPHRLSPSEIESRLWWVIGSEHLRGESPQGGNKNTSGPKARDSDDEGAEPTPLPHKPPLPKLPAKESLDADLKTARRVVAGQCAKCHVEYEPALKFVAPPNDGLTRELQLVLERSVKAQIPAVWLKSANFHHAKHEFMSCVDCHGAAIDSEQHADVLFGARRGDGGHGLVELRTKCAECHRPEPAHGGSATAYARFDCAECHHYHGGETPRHAGGGAFRTTVSGPTAAR
jgi:hypothetical protein